MFLNIKKFLGKRLLYGTCITGTAILYCYQKHMYEKELFTRMNYLLQNKIPLSGVYLQQRQPFGSIWFIHWIMPYHQSLKIMQKDGSIRHVGLGRNPEHKHFYDLSSEFILHKGVEYNRLSEYEISFPIECWVDYKRKYGKFPENIDINKLNEITMTREEATSKDLPNIYKTIFSKPTKDDNNDFVFTSCRSAVMYAIRKEELNRKQKS